MKYKLTNETLNYLDKILYRIEALKDFGNVKKGDLGGFIEKESNLSQDGNAWVSGNARVFDNAWVYGDAMVFGDARVSGNAWVYGDAMVSGNARVFDNAWVYGDAMVFDNAWVYDNARVFGDVWVSGNALVYGNAMVSGDAEVSGNARVFGNAIATKKVININLTYNITLTDNHIQIGCKQFTFEKALKLNKRWENTLENEEFAEEIERDRQVIVALIKRQMEETK